MDKTQRTRPWQKRGFERSVDKDQSGSEDCDRRPDIVLIYLLLLVECRRCTVALRVHFQNLVQSIQCEREGNDIPPWFPSFRLCAL